MIGANAILRFVELFATIDPLIPYYHVVSDERLIHVCHSHPYKSSRQFANDLDFLCRRYRPLSLTDLIDHARQGKALPKRGFIITFDDGYSQIHSVIAPMLLKKGIPAIIFLTSDFLDNRSLSLSNKISLIVDRLLNGQRRVRAHDPRLLELLGVSPARLVKRIQSISRNESCLLDDIAPLVGVDFAGYLAAAKPYLGSGQVLDLINNGFYFGAHSIDHPYFRGLPLQEQLNQALGSMKFLKERFGLSYSLFAFPHNDRYISRDFFRNTEKAFDLTFGTCGITTDPIPTNLQRINFERSLRPASRIVARQLLKKAIWRHGDKAQLKRDGST